MAGSRPGEVVTCAIGSAARKEEIVLCLYNRGWPPCACQCDGEHRGNLVSSNGERILRSSKQTGADTHRAVHSHHSALIQGASNFHFKPVSNTEGRCQVGRRYSRGLYINLEFGVSASLSRDASPSFVVSCWKSFTFFNGVCK